MLENDASRLQSIKDAGGVLVSHDDGEFWALFDNSFRAMLDNMVETTAPALTALHSDVDGIRKGRSLIVNGVTYKLLRAEPDESQGFTVLILAR